MDERFVKHQKNSGCIISDRALLCTGNDYCLYLIDSTYVTALRCLVEIRCGRICALKAVLSQHREHERLSELQTALYFNVSYDYRMYDCPSETAPSQCSSYDDLLNFTHKLNSSLRRNGMGEAL